MILYMEQMKSGEKLAKRLLESTILRSYQQQQSLTSKLRDTSKRMRSCAAMAKASLDGAAHTEVLAAARETYTAARELMASLAAEIDDLSAGAQEGREEYHPLLEGATSAEGKLPRIFASAPLPIISFDDNKAGPAANEAGAAREVVVLMTAMRTHLDEVEEHHERKTSEGIPLGLAARIGSTMRDFEKLDLAIMCSEMLRSFAQSERAWCVPFPSRPHPPDDCGTSHTKMPTASATSNDAQLLLTQWFSCHTCTGS